MIFDSKRGHRRGSRNECYEAAIRNEVWHVPKNVNHKITLRAVASLLPSREPQKHVACRSFFASVA